MLQTAFQWVGKSRLWNNGEAMNHYLNNINKLIYIYKPNYSYNLYQDKF